MHKDIEINVHGSVYTLIYAKTKRGRRYYWVKVPDGFTFRQFCAEYDEAVEICQLHWVRNIMKKPKRMSTPRRNNALKRTDKEILREVKKGDAAAQKSVQTDVEKISNFLEFTSGDDWSLHDLGIDFGW